MRGKTLERGAIEPARRHHAGNGHGKVDEAAESDPAEHLTRDLARVRAKFGVDPALAGRSLAAAWKSETPLEEDEAEFVDAVADCLVVGLSLDDALNCWDDGGLAYQAGDEGGSADGDPDREDETVPIPLARPRRASGAHRVLVR